MLSESCVEFYKGVGDMSERRDRVAAIVLAVVIIVLAVVFMARASEARGGGGFGGGGRSFSSGRSYGSGRSFSGGRSSAPKVATKAAPKVAVKAVQKPVANLHPAAPRKILVVERQSIVYRNRPVYYTQSNHFWFWWWIWVWHHDQWVSEQERKKQEEIRKQQRGW